MNNFKAFVCIAFSFVLLWAGCKACSPDEVKSLSETPMPEPVKNNIQSGDINDTHLTVDDRALIESGEIFKSRMNNFFDDAGISLHLGKLNTTSGEVNNTFQVFVNDHIGIIGVLNKSNNSIKEISMIGQGDGTSLSGANILFAMGAIIASCDPSLATSERGDILRELGLFDEGMDINTLNKSTGRNGLKYWVVSSRVVGITFGVSLQE